MCSWVGTSECGNKAEREAHALVGLPLERMDVDGSWMAGLRASLMRGLIYGRVVGVYRHWLARWFLTVRMVVLAAFGVERSIGLERLLYRLSIHWESCVRTILGCVDQNASLQV
jgi:hypothetical protein